MNPENDVSKTCGKVAKALDFHSLPKRHHAEWVDWYVYICHKQWIKIEGGLISEYFYSYSVLLVFNSLSQGDLLAVSCCQDNRNSL